MLFNYLVRAGEQRRRYGEAKRLGRREIDYQLDLRDLLDRQVSRLLTLENPAGVDAHHTPTFRNTGAVANQAARHGELTGWVDRGHSVAKRQCGELFAVVGEECVSADHKCAYPQLHQGCKDRIEVAFGLRMQDMDLQSESASGDPRVFQ